MEKALGGQGMQSCGSRGAKPLWGPRGWMGRVDGSGQYAELSGQAGRVVRWQRGHKVQPSWTVAHQGLCSVRHTHTADLSGGDVQEATSSIWLAIKEIFQHHQVLESTLNLARPTRCQALTLRSWRPWG